MNIKFTNLKRFLISNNTKKHVKTYIQIINDLDKDEIIDI